MAEKTDSLASDALAPFGFNAMMQMHRPVLAAMAEMNGRLYESVAAANKEWATFVNQCLKEDLAVPQQLARCRTAQDFYQVYAQFLQNAWAQYQSGLEQMTKLQQGHRRAFTAVAFLGTWPNAALAG